MTPSLSLLSHPEFDENLGGVGTRASREYMIAGLYDALVPRSPMGIVSSTVPIISSGIAFECATAALVNVVSDSFRDVMQFGINLSGQTANVVCAEGYSVWNDPSRLSRTEQYAELLSAFRAMASKLQIERGERSQERFMFREVMPFIQQYGIEALEMFDELMTTTTLPDSAQ